VLCLRPHRSLSSELSIEAKLPSSCDDELKQIQSIEGILEAYALRNDSEFGSFTIAYVKKVGGLKSVKLSNGTSADCTHILSFLDKGLIKKVQLHLDPFGAALNQFNMYGESK